TGHCKTVELGFAVEDVPGDAALGTGSASLRVYANPGHRRQVDHHAAVDRRAPGDIVAAAAHGDLELLLARQFDRVDDVGDTAAPGDQRRPLVDQPVMDFSGILVARIGRLE